MLSLNQRVKALYAAHGNIKKRSGEIKNTDSQKLEKKYLNKFTFETKPLHSDNHKTFHLSNWLILFIFIVYLLLVKYSLFCSTITSI